MAFRRPKGWLFTASPRHNSRLPFRRAMFPRSGGPRPGVSRSAAPAPAGAPAVPWWRTLIDNFAAAPPRHRAHRDVAALPRRDEMADARASRSAREAAAHDAWRPITERLDRQREQLTSMDGHLRRLVELQTEGGDCTARYAPPA